MANLSKLLAFEILDSRGNPTIKTIAYDNQGRHVWSAVPSGASTGSYEAIELRDGTGRYGGKGVTKAVANVNTTIATKLSGTSLSDVRALDAALCELDGTPNKANLGANAVLSVSLACTRLAALDGGVPLFSYLNSVYFSSRKPIIPQPLVNILNGGKHATKSIDFQECMIVPLASTSFSHTMQVVSEIYHALAKILRAKNFTTTVGDEGGFAPQLSQNKEAFDLLLSAIEAVGLIPGKDVGLAIDCASTELFDEGHYHLRSENRSFTSSEFSGFLEELVEHYPFVAIEDPFDEDDWEGFAGFTARVGETVQVIGDDLYVTNPTRLSRGIKEHTTNSILIKPNQIGTLSETADAIISAFEAGWSAVISHRSGETSDSFIADLAVACGCGLIKTGAPARGERVSKYNRLLEIETLHHLPLAQTLHKRSLTNGAKSTPHHS